jgi:hypothetical protein
MLSYLFAQRLGGLAYGEVPFRLLPPAVFHSGHRVRPGFRKTGCKTEKLGARSFPKQPGASPALNGGRRR